MNPPPGRRSECKHPLSKKTPGVTFDHLRYAEMAAENGHNVLRLPPYHYVFKGPKQRCHFSTSSDDVSKQVPMLYRVTRKLDLLGCKLTVIYTVLIQSANLKADPKVRYLGPLTR
jgi:hypothetical protein